MRSEKEDEEESEISHLGLHGLVVIAISKEMKEEEEDLQMKTNGTVVYCTSSSENQSS